MLTLDNTNRYILKVNIKRYPGKVRLVWPQSIEIIGTKEQAQYVAETLSFNEPGCDFYWYVEGVDDLSETDDNVEVFKICSICNLPIISPAWYHCPKCNKHGLASIYSNQCTDCSNKE